MLPADHLFAIRPYLAGLAVPLQLRSLCYKNMEHMENVDDLHSHRGLSSCDGSGRPDITLDETAPRGKGF